MADPPARHVALFELDERITACRACPRLVEWREQVAAEKRAAYSDQTYWGRPVPGFGDPDARMLVMGLAPAAHGANRTGRMFTGDRSGDFLYAALWRAGFANQPESVSIDDGLRLSDVYISAPVRCAPPANKPTADERHNCAPFLDEELALMPQIKVVLGLGGIGFAAVARILGFERQPKFGHGAEAVAPDGRVLLGCYHVSQQNTFTGRLTEPMIDDVLARARELIGP